MRTADEQTREAYAHANLAAAELVERSVSRREATLSASGALCVVTSPYTGRSPQDKFFVREPGSESRIWWGKVNQPFEVDAYDRLRRKVVAHLEGAERFVLDCTVGADPALSLPLRVITERAWCALFARNMFRSGGRRDPELTVLHAPGFKANPDEDGTRSEAFVILNPARQEILIGGTGYAGEIKKSVFTYYNDVLPQRGAFPMHCSANFAGDGSAAVFFGLSGTGKTTLSADSSRTLVGDDEHGWSDDGVFNFEGGCYAKVIRLSASGEPEIWSASRRFGAVLENVVLDPVTREVDFDDESITENTRSSYPIGFIPNASPSGRASHPRDVVFLTADAFGVLPPLARLTADQAAYWFLTGYTAKIAGTERGITEPQATFSVCFGAPFLPQPPHVYAKLLMERLERHKPRVWLVNTGWTGGPYGVGKRFQLAATRAMVHAALDGMLDYVPTERDPVFGIQVPMHCPGVPSQLLRPRTAWSDAHAYDEQATKLAGMFRENFQGYAPRVSEDVRRAGPA